MEPARHTKPGEERVADEMFAALFLQRADRASGYLPLVSTFCFSSSFIFLIVGSRLASPVVWVVVAGGALFGIEVWSGGVFSGRVAVVLGGEFVCALAACTLKRRTLDSSDTASVRGFSALGLEALSFGFIDLAPVRSMKTACAV
jgi:hypothetical protein